MEITVQNISATSATVGWLPSPGCRGGFYSVMYHPEWNGLLMGYTRRSFLREAVVPAGQTSASLGDLSPHTTYVLCVTCQATHSARDRCKTFNTLQEADMGVGHGGGVGGVVSRELAMGVWLASTVLLLVIAGVLLYGCVHSWCRWGSESDGNRKDGTGHPYAPECAMGEPQPASITTNRRNSAETLPLCNRVPRLVPLSTQPKTEGPCATP